MHTDLHHKSLSHQDYAALTDAAKQRAVELRREAIRALWATAARGLRIAWRGLRRDVSVAPLNPPSSRA